MWDDQPCHWCALAVKVNFEERKRVVLIQQQTRSRVLLRHGSVGRIEFHCWDWPSLPAA